MTSLPRARRAVVGAGLLLGLALAPTSAAPGGVIPIPTTRCRAVRRTSVRLRSRTRSPRHGRRSTRSWLRTPATTSTTTPTRPTPTAVPGRWASHRPVRSTLQVAECASLTFDRRGRLETVCVGVARPDPEAVRPRDAEAAGVVPAAQPSARRRRLHRLLRRRLLLPRPPRPRGDPDRHQPHPRGRAEPRGHGFVLRRDYDLTRAMARDDKIVSVLPAWTGGCVRHRARLVGAIDPAPARCGCSRSARPSELVRRRRDRRHLRRHHRGALPAGRWSRTPPDVTWREAYPNVGTTKPGQTSPGSGTTPTLMDGELGRDHRQRRPDERRGLPARHRGDRRPRGLLGAGLRARAPAPPTTR